MALLTFTDRGIYCERADIYIDPWKPVSRALITHGHSDHARWGHKKYLCTNGSAPIIRYRLGNIELSSLEYGEVIKIHGVTFSFHPAGHVPGSAQIRAEYKGEVWVVSGDYKVAPDGLAEAFEPIRCNHFVTESTFGLPVFRWTDQQAIMEEINAWWAKNKAEGKVSLLSAYALGKAQRLINHLDPALGTVYTHGAVENTNNVLRKAGYTIARTTKITKETKTSDLQANIVIAPPSAIGSPWSKKLKPLSVAFASGWMAMRGTRRRRAADRGFVLSDHADWDELNLAIKETQAAHVYVTHGYTTAFRDWLRGQGYDAHVVSTAYSGDEGDTADDAASFSSFDL